MKAKVSVDKLSGVLELVKRVPSDKTTIPATAGVLVEFFPDNTLKIHANNTKQWVVVTLDEGVEVDVAGALVVPAKRFIGWVKTFSLGKVSFSLDPKDETTLKISVGSARTKIKCYPKDALPEVPTQQVKKEDVTFTVSSEDFEKKMHSITWAFKQERDALPTHRAVNMLCRQDGTVQVRAFDGIGSLAQVNLGIENPSPRPEEFSVFVPDEVLDALTFYKGSIDVAVTEKKIEFIQDKLMGGGLTLVGNFPDATTLLSNLDGLPVVRLPIDAFKAAIGRLDIILDNAISCLFDIAPTDFVLLSREGTPSSVSEHIPVNTENIEGGVPPRSIALSLPYMKSLLAHYAGGEFIFKFDQRKVVFLDPAVSDDWIGFMAQMTKG